MGKKLLTMCLYCKKSLEMGLITDSFVCVTTPWSKRALY